MKTWRIRQTVSKRSNCEMNDATTRKRRGSSQLVVLLEVAVLVVVVWGVISLIPHILFPRRAAMAADARRIDKPVLRIYALQDGHRLWGQLGPSEIVSIDLRTKEAGSVYHQNHRLIGNWCISHDGATVLLSDDQSDVEIFRNDKRILSEHVDESHRLLTALSMDGNGAVRIADDTMARYWQLSADEPMVNDFILAKPADKIGVNPTGQLLAASSSHECVQVYNLKTGQLVRSLNTHSTLSKTPVFSPDGKWLAVVHGPGISLFDVESGEAAWSTQTTGPQPFNCVAFSANGKWLAASGLTSGIHVMECSSGQLHCKFPTNWSLSKVTFSPTEDVLYSGSADGLIRKWSLVTGTLTDEINLYDEVHKTSKDQM